MIDGSELPSLSARLLDSSNPSDVMARAVPIFASGSERAGDLFRDII